MQVVIVDSRPKWMIREDKQMPCMTHCRLWSQCATKVGHDCKVLGGHIIPKIRTKRRERNVET